MKIRRIFGFCAVAALLLTGCSSVEYYHDRAVSRAREYLVDHAPELTAEELYYVKYHKPVFLVSDVVGGVAVGGRSNLVSEQQQICITWKFPERKEYYMVYGVSSRTMEWWYPSRLIRKAFEKQQSSALKIAVAGARSYAQNNLWETMPTATQNQIRFREPWVLKTDFNLNFNPDGKLSPEELDKARETAAKRTQISLVWKPESGDWVFFSGTVGEKYSGWSVLMAGFLSPEEVQKHTLETLAIPGEDGKTRVVAPELLEEITPADPKNTQKPAAAPVQKQK